MKNTAVEWLENEFQEMCKDFGGLHTDFIERFEQAKAMEKEQIELAFLKGHEFVPEWKINNVPYIDAEQYYQENFKSE